MKDRGAEDAPAREAIKALQTVWLMAYRYMPNDRDILDEIAERLDKLSERYS